MAVEPGSGGAVVVAPGHVITIGIYGDGKAEAMFIVGVLYR